MSGIYGSMLLLFPEQQRSLVVFDMQPKINGGWTEKENETSVIGIYQNSRRKAIKDSNGNLVYVSGQEFWTETAGLIGRFTQISGDIYRLTGTGNWNHEGGFYVYDLEKMVGNNGAEPIDPSWNTGSNSFG